MGGASSEGTREGVEGRLMPPAIEALIERLLGAEPELRPRYLSAVAECEAAGFPDTAPWELLESHTRGLIDRFVANPSAGRGRLAQLATLLEDEYGNDPDVDSLIDAGFLTPFGSRHHEPDPAEVLMPRLADALANTRNWRARPSDLALVERLIASVPALEPLASENTYGDHDDVLIHPFLSDVVRWVVENFEAGQLEEVTAVLDVLESSWGGEVDEPIAVSFVEALPYTNERGAALVQLLGPQLRAELTRQRGSS